MIRDNVLYRDGKWDGVMENPLYNSIRDKITGSFDGLVFDEGPHKYYLNGRELECVSNVTHLFQEHFDCNRVAVETYERNYDNPDSKYYRMTPEMILESWRKISDEACRHGTERHEFGESCFYFMTGQYDRILDDFKDRLVKPEDGVGEYGFRADFPKEMAIIKFWDDIPGCVVPILAETKVYDEELGYSGTFDILFYYDNDLDARKVRRPSGLWIYDYKSNRDLYKNFAGKRLLEPFADLLDMPLSLYKLQLSLYQNCLEKIGFGIVNRTIIWMKPTGEYDKLHLECYTDKLIGYLRENRTI